MTGRGVVGPHAGAQLRIIPSEVMTWFEWKAKHPKTTVLKPPKPIASYRHVNRYYERYHADDDNLFPLHGVKSWPKTYKNKENVTIVVRAGKARCYPHAALREGVNEDGDLRIVKEGIAVKVLDKEGKDVPSALSYWFAFWAFYPEGTVWERKQE